jgi:TolB protein
MRVKVVHGLWFMVLGLWFGVAIVSTAQVTVTVPGAVKRSFAVTGFAGDAAAAGTVTEVLKNDLRLSGRFQLAPSVSAEFVQQGSVRGDHGGVTIECVVRARATGKVVLSKSYQGSAQDLRRAVHRLSDDIVLAVTGERGIAQTKIAFVLSRGKAKELAVMDYDGHNARQLTYDRSISVRPRWSPDGRKIVYTSYKNLFPDVLEVELYTGARRRLASFPGLNSGAVFSPDGSTIALTLSKDGNPELYTMSASGGGLRRLTRTRGAESSPTWSHDGQSIAYVSDDRGSPQIYMIGREGGEPVRLTVSPSYNTEPDWSRPPAGSGLQPMIAVTSRAGGRFQIGLYDSATREVRAVVADGADNQDPSWAPDGRHLVFAKTRMWRSQLYLLDVLTGEQVELPAVEGGASEPAWGP